MSLNRPSPVSQTGNDQSPFWLNPASLKIPVIPSFRMPNPLICGERNGVRLAFVGASFMAAVALVLQQKMIEDDKADEASISSNSDSGVEKNPLKLLPLMNPALKGLLVSDILIRFCEQIPYTFVVGWCMKVISEPVSAVQFGLLTTIEMATAVLVYIPVAYLADRTTKKPFVLMTLVFFTFFPLALYYSRSMRWLVFTFVLRGLKEFGEPTRKSLIMDLAPDSCKAGMFGLYYLIRDVSLLRLLVVLSSGK